MSTPTDRPRTLLIVDAVQRHRFEIEVFLPMDEAWKRREELARPYLNDKDGEPLWTAARYSAEETSSDPLPARRVGERGRDE